MSASTADLRIPRASESERAEDEIRSRAETLPRSVEDVRLLRRISLAALVQSLLLVVSLGTTLYLAARPPQQVIIERIGDDDRVIGINGQAVAGAVVIGPDRPGAADKKTLAREWATSRFAIDPITRERDLEKMFRLMAPAAAKAYSDLMKKQGDLERERSEGWQAIWTPQVVEIDRADPYRVNVVGAWEITKGGEAGRREAKQLMFSLHLLPDSDRGRSPRNAQTGFLVDDILDYRELPATPGAQSTLRGQ
jgi:hypothetical protein